jgi:hypothetical protein
MGKKAKSAGGVAKASSRKPDRSTWPPPPKPIHEEVSVMTLDAQDGLVTESLTIFL